MLSTEQDRLAFWQQRQQVYPRLAPFAMDLVSAPASEAYWERVFSVCGELCNGIWEDEPFVSEPRETSIHEVEHGTPQFHMNVL